MGGKLARNGYLPFLVTYLGTLTSSATRHFKHKRQLFAQQKYKLIQIYVGESHGWFVYWQLLNMVVWRQPSG